MKHMKRYTAILVLSLVFAAACGVRKETKTSSSRPAVFVLVYDISKSNESYALLDTMHLARIYENLGKGGGGMFYGLLIDSYSAKQEPLQFTIPQLDTLFVKGNRIQQSNIAKKNVQRKAVFETGKGEFVSRASVALMREKKEAFSDIQNALLLVKQIITRPDYADWDVRVLLVTDLLNDLPPVNGTDPLSSIDLPASTQIGVVRPSPKISLEKVFPNLTVTNYATIQDGIQSLTLNH